MATPFHLTIASVSENLFDGEAISATFPGTAGVLTVLANHEPLVTTLAPGTVSIKPVQGEPVTLEVTAGVLEISHNQATLIL
jgi:F-type H+-transporting ATPase subunit epsilon